MMNITVWIPLGTLDFGRSALIMSQDPNFEETVVVIDGNQKSRH